MNQLEKACEGKSLSQGGLNIPQMKAELIKQFPSHAQRIQNASSRAEINAICQELVLRGPKSAEKVQEVFEKVTKIPIPVYEPEYIAPKISKVKVIPPIKKELKPIDVNLCKVINNFQNDYDLSALICSQLSIKSENKPEWKRILEIMTNCPIKSECDPCTSIGFKLAKSLIKIASTRIFATPEQSIMELPVNSLDSYNPDRKVGKFGMGFFSIFYWLIGHPKREIVINSYTKNEKGEYCAYGVVIKEIDGLLTFAMKSFDVISDIKTGFRVYLDCSLDNFSDIEVIEFYNQLDRLNFVEGGKLMHQRISSQRERPGSTFNTTVCNFTYFGGDKNSTNIINIAIDKKYIWVEDYATGVPLEILFGSLFVPSISTKTIQLSSVSIPFKNNSRIHKGNPAYDILPKKLLILVNGVAIVDIKLPNVIAIHSSIYLLDLPANTRLPVSRDDIILTPNTKKAMKESINILFNESIKQYSDVSKLQELLDLYIDYTPNIDNKNLIKSILNDLYNMYIYRYVPSKYISIYKSIPELKFIVIGSNIYNVYMIEKWLDENIISDKTIWYGIKVVNAGRVKDKITNGGLYNYLFIDNNYIKSLGNDWIVTITTSYKEMQLYQYDSTHGQKMIEKYQTMTVRDLNKIPGMWIKHDNNTLVMDIFNKSVVNVVYAVLNKFESLNVYFDIRPNAQYHLIKTLIELYDNLSSTGFIDILNTFLKLFASFKGNQTYGGQRHTISILYTVFPKKPKQVLEVDEKFTVDFIKYSISSTVERSYTSIEIKDDLYPSIMYYKHFIQSKSSKIFFDQVLLQSKNYPEFINAILGAGSVFMIQLSCYYPSSIKNLNLNFDKIDEGSIIAYVATIINDIRSHPIWTSIDSINYIHSELGSQCNLPYIYLTEMQNKTIEWVKVITNRRDLPIIQLPIIPDSYLVKFTTNDMIDYLFTHNLPSSESFNNKSYIKFLTDIEINKDITKKSPVKSLQIVEIAVNEGTVKPFIDASLTELTQNSIDAIREFKPKKKSIDIRLVKTKGNKNLILSIIDYVGMSPTAFIYIGIPFLSTKTPSELVTGEMGSGFFNVYRESDMVIITTNKDGYQITSYDVPVRDDNGRVVDIVKTITNPKTTSDMGTTIDIVLKIDDETDYIQKVNQIEFYIQHVLSLAMTESIYFNNIDIHLNRDLIIKIGYYELYCTNLYNNSPISHESYLLTKGIPFSPLASMLDKKISEYDMINQNFIINITHGGYVPMQTRTKIRYESETSKNDFKNILEYSIFIKTLLNIRYLNANPDNYLDHFSSTGNTSQLKFTIYPYPLENNVWKSSSYYFKYGKFFNDISIAELINKCIDIMGDKSIDHGYMYYDHDIHMLISKTINTYKVSDKHIERMIHIIVFNWLENKNKNPPKPVTVIKDVIVTDPNTGKNKIKTIEIIPPDIPDNDFQILIQIWVNVYWDIAKNQGIYGYEKQSPNVKVAYSPENKGKSGFYRKSDNLIFINTLEWNDLESQVIFREINKNDPDVFMSLPTMNNKLWKDIFGYFFPSSTIAHELEHARRSESHDSSSHSTSYNKLYEGDTITERTFEQCANAVYEKILANGFVSKFLDKYNSVEKSITYIKKTPIKKIFKQESKKIPKQKTKVPKKTKQEVIEPKIPSKSKLRADAKEYIPRT